MTLQLLLAAKFVPTTVLLYYQILILTLRYKIQIKILVIVSTIKLNCLISFQCTVEEDLWYKRQMLLIQDTLWYNSIPLTTLFDDRTKKLARFLIKKI